MLFYLLAIITVLTGLLFVGSLRRANLTRRAQKNLALFMVLATVGPLLLYWRIGTPPSSGWHSVFVVIYILFFGSLVMLPIVFLGMSLALTLMETNKRNLIVILSCIFIAIFAESYFGHKSGTEWSPDKRYRVEYYEIFPYLRAIFPTAPGDGGLPFWGWVRLYDACDHKLQEKFSPALSALIMGEGHWLDDQLIYLGEEKISWPLPEGACQS